MMILRAVFVLFFLVLLFGLVVIFIHWHGQIRMREEIEDALYLTPFVNNDTVQEGRKRSLVSPLVGGIKSYSGYLTVNSSLDSNLFFWYFPAEIEAETAPVVVWIDEGPGVSSIYGLFLENGPYRIISTEFEDVAQREDYWSRYLHVIYLDGSVGTGFSFTNDELGYSTSSESTASNLYNALLQFFHVFPEIRNNDLYVGGESYGSIYVTALSHRIRTDNPSAEIKINLKGLLIGNGLIDPEHQMVYSDYLYEISLIDHHQKKVMEQIENKIIDLMKRKKWLEANGALSDLITGELGGRSLFTNLTGFRTITNYLLSDQQDMFSKVNRLFENNWVRNRIHVGNATFTSLGRNKARCKLDGEIMKTSRNILSPLMNNYKVLLYNGQLDILFGYTGTENAVENIEWCGSSMFQCVERKQWLVNGLLAGYTKTVSPPNCTGSLTLALVRNAGHKPSRDQPVWTQDLVVRFTKNIPLQ